jgi:hypothetical protein
MATQQVIPIAVPPQVPAIPILVSQTECGHIPEICVASA